MLTLKLGGRFPCWGFVFVSTGWFNHRLVVEWTFWCRTLQSHGGTWVMTWTLLSFFFGQVHSERVPCKFWNCLKFSSSTSRFEKSIIYSLKIYTWNQGRDTFASTFIYIHVFVNKIDIQNTQQKTQTHTHTWFIWRLSQFQKSESHSLSLLDRMFLTFLEWRGSILFAVCTRLSSKKGRGFEMFWSLSTFFLGGAKLLEAMFESPTTFY